jgi:hypothetical protein
MFLTCKANAAAAAAPPPPHPMALNLSANIATVYLKLLWGINCQPETQFDFKKLCPKNSAPQNFFTQHFASLENCFNQEIFLTRNMPDKKNFNDKFCFTKNFFRQKYCFQSTILF